jgi:hypothetical protein
VRQRHFPGANNKFRNTKLSLGHKEGDKSGWRFGNTALIYAVYDEKLTDDVITDTQRSRNGIINLLNNINPNYIASIQLILLVYHTTKQIPPKNAPCHFARVSYNVCRTRIQSLCRMDSQLFLFHSFRAFMLKGVIYNCLLVSPWWPELQHRQPYSTFRIK